MCQPVSLLNAVKGYLKVTWQDTATDTDAEIQGYINRGMARLQQIAGAPLDFTVEGQPRSLLLDYCRYANSQALEVFEKNFQAELLDLNLSTQAPVIDRLVVILAATSETTVFAKVVPGLYAGNSYAYRVGAALTLPARLDTCTPETWARWDGSSAIPATVGQDVMIVEIDGEYAAQRAGKATV